MTPTAIRIVSQLRQEFYSLFAAMMQVSVNVTSGNSSTSTPSMVFWLDGRQRLNYLYIYAHTAPDDLIPERPFVLRLAINKSAGTLTAPGRGRGSREFNHAWDFELTLLPEEIMDFLPWIVGLIQACNGKSALIPEPPHPLQGGVSDAILLHHAQTCTAGSKLTQRRDSDRSDRQLNLTKGSLFR